MDLKKHKERYQKNKKKLRAFISAMESADLSMVMMQAKEASDEVWEKVDCTACANCCKQMTPTLEDDDIARIAAHLNLSVLDFKLKYLLYEKDEEHWRMQEVPCVFLDQQTNLCTIYEVRPEDCRGFPHLLKAPLEDYVHIHKQNIKYCPASYFWVKKMMKKITID